MSNNHNQNAAASSSKGPSDVGASRPNLPPTPMSLPRANTAPAPAPRVMQAKSIDECVPMEPTASQQLELAFDVEIDMSDVMLDADAYPTTAGGSHPSPRRRSASQEASDDTFIAKAGLVDVKPRHPIVGPPAPMQRAATTTSAINPSARTALKPDSSPAEPSTATSSSGDSTRSAQARPAARVGGFNDPAGHVSFVTVVSSFIRN
jgi:hypothetical protein